MKLLYKCLAAVLAGIALAMLCMLIAPPAKSDPKETQFDCVALAEGLSFFADLRDVGGKVDLVVRMARERKPDDMSPLRFAVIEREIRRLWAERLPANEAQFSLYRRCKAQLGDMGREA